MGYEKSAQYYDLFGEKPDINYYKHLGKQYGAALEVGVGTARVALELAKAHIEVWGIDNCEQMLEVASQKISVQPAAVQKRISLITAEMTDFELSRTFPYIYLPSSGLSHCITTEDQLNCLKCIRNHLEKGGLFAFDLMLPGQSYNTALTLIDTKEVEGDVVRRWICHRPDFTNQLLHTTLVFEVYTQQELTKRIVESSTVSLIYKRELLLLLDKANFTVQHLCGDFSRSEQITDFLVVEAVKP